MDKSQTTTTTAPKKKHPLHTRRKFRLSFINENTFNEIWTLKLSQRRVVLLVILLTVAFASMIAMLIVFTPIKTLLPGYLKQSQRQENVVNSMRVDSMATQLRIVSAYSDNFRKIINDELDAGQTAPTQENSLSTTDSLITSSESERRFVKQYDQRNRYNVNVLSTIAPDGLLFFNPLPSASVASGQNADGPLHLTAPDRSTVMSMHSGTVIDAYYSPKTANTVIIQHPDGIVTKYSGISALTIENGTSVRPGTPIGLMLIGRNDVNKSTPPILSIEIWNKGSRLNPLEFLSWE